jgi:hypothetical protein
MLALRSSVLTNLGSNQKSLISSIGGEENSKANLKSELVMRGKLISQTARWRITLAIGHFIPKGAQLKLQFIKLLLVTKKRLIERFNSVFCKP